MMLWTGLIQRNNMYSFLNLIETYVNLLIAVKQWVTLYHTPWGGEALGGGDAIVEYDTPTDPSEAPVKILLGYGSIWNQNSDIEFTPADSSVYCPQGRATEIDKMQEFPIESTPDTAISSRVDTSQSSKQMQAPESRGESYQEAFEKEKQDKWSEEEGKTAMGTNAFNAVLSNADEDIMAQVGLQWRISELRVALRASERFLGIDEETLLQTELGLEPVALGNVNLSNESKENWKGVPRSEGSGQGLQTSAMT
eukprot:Gb_25864 [translate_table: standard]